MNDRKRHGWILLLGIVAVAAIGLPAAIVATDREREARRWARAENALPAATAHVDEIERRIRAGESPLHVDSTGERPPADDPLLLEVSAAKQVSPGSWTGPAWSRPGSRTGPGGFRGVIPGGDAVRLYRLEERTADGSRTFDAMTVERTVAARGETWEIEVQVELPPE